LWFAREAAIRSGWSALEVLGEPGEHDEPLLWERACTDRAIEAAGDARVLVIGKSLASLLAAEVAERELPAVWLTPLLTEAPVIEGLARTRHPTLLAGGDADPTWRLDALPAGAEQLEVLELPGVDHAVQVPGDPEASIEALVRLVAGIGRFLARVG
jgi:pimeloyl-ACP methyl ester carboxylesterase